MVLCLITVLSSTIKAADYQSHAARLPHGTNYIDFRNIKVAYRDIDMRTPVKVKEDTLYTVVLDLDFIGPNTFDQDEYPVMTVCVSQDVDCETVDMSVDRTRSFWHVSFVTTADTVLLQNVPVTGLTGYNFMMYEGSYADFKGFEYYVSYEPITYEGVYIMDYDRPKSKAELREQLTVSDPKGGPISVDLIESTFDEANLDIGEYYLKYKATDRMSNVSYFKLVIQVIDRVAPTITGQDTFTIEQGKTITLSSIVNQMVITDNVDPLTPDSIEVLKDTYTPNQNKAGNYEIELSVKDRSKNETRKIVTVNVKDIFAPYFIGPSAIYTYLGDGGLTAESILAMYKAMDTNDGDLTHLMTIQMMDYKPNEVKVFTVYLRCKDQAGNEIVQPVPIHVIDDTAPVFQTTEYVMTKEEFEAMSREDVLAWLSAKLQASGVEATNLSILLDETEHLENKRRQAYIYYSYEVEGKVHQSRLSIEYPKDQTISPVYFIVGASVLLIGATSYVVLKKLKKH